MTIDVSVDAPSRDEGKTPVVPATPCGCCRKINLKRSAEMWTNRRICKPSVRANLNFVAEILKNLWSLFCGFVLPCRDEVRLFHYILSLAQTTSRTPCIPKLVKVVASPIEQMILTPCSSSSARYRNCDAILLWLAIRRQPSSVILHTE